MALSKSLFGTIKSSERGNFDLPLIAAITANLLWGITFLASKSTLVAWGPFTAAALRFVLASAFLYFGTLIVGQKIIVPKGRSVWTGLAWIAVTGFGLLYPLQLTGLQTISSALSASIMLTSPLFVVILDKLLLRERIGPSKFIAIFLGIVGGAILLTDGFSKTFLISSWVSSGAGLTLLASFSLAVSVIQTRKLSKHINPVNITFWSMSIGAALLLVSSLIIEPDSHFASTDVNAWVSIIFLAVVCSAVCFYVWNFALANASPKKIASTMHLKTPTAVLASIFILNEGLKGSVVIGIAVVMTGVLLSQVSAFGKKS